MSLRRIRWRVSAALYAAIAALALVAPALLVAAQAAPTSSSPRPTAHRGSQFTDPAGVLAGAPFRGAILSGLQLHPSAMLADLERMKLDGINTVSVYILTYVNNPQNATTVRTNGPKTPSDEELTLVTNMAHNLGLAVEFMPILWNTGPYVWRGVYRYSNVRTFFASYRAMIDHYTDLANSLGVELFAIGSENRSLIRYTNLWRSLAADVRSRYQGLITAMALPSYAANIKWWPSVDMISLSPYFTLSSRDNPSVSELVWAWNQVLPFVAGLSTKYHEPVLFDEIGYVSTLKAAWHPYNDKRGVANPSQQAQARAYEALYQATANQPWLRGIVWYYWQIPTNAPSLDTSATPVGKTAECVIARHWAPNPTVAAALANIGTVCSISRL